MLYILLSGYPPFNGENEEELYEKILAGKFDFNGEEWGYVSKEGKSLIKQMLQLDQEKRYSSEQVLLDP